MRCSEKGRGICCEIDADAEVHSLQESVFNGHWSCSLLVAEIEPVVQRLWESIADAGGFCSADTIAEVVLLIRHMQQRILVPLETSDAVVIEVGSQGHLATIHVDNITLALHRPQFGIPAGIYGVHTERIGKRGIHHSVRRRGGLDADVQDDHPLNSLELRIQQNLNVVDGVPMINTTLVLYSDDEVIRNETLIFEKFGED